jgi:hypothetical protein
MPPLPKDLNPFRDEIEHRIAQKEPQSKIREWLATKGVQVSKNTLSTRIVAWEASRRSKTIDSDPTLLAVIETEYHITYYDD